MKKVSIFLLLQIIVIIIIGSIFYLHKDKVIVAKRPPVSLADWYKPKNKRQVWLHTMFNLRREVQAIKLYSKQDNPLLMNNWTTKFEQHYLDIAKMVPQWKSKLDYESLTQLKESSANGDYQTVNQSLVALQKTCDSCHDDYRVTTALIYRIPSFDGIPSSSNLSYKEQMSQLSSDVNQIKIAMIDNQMTIALDALSKVKKNMFLLGETCSTCHEKNTPQYPSHAMKLSINNLETKLINGTLKEQGQELGTLAVIACAKCHGTHRYIYDASEQLSKLSDWESLIKH